MSCPFFSFHIYISSYFFLFINSPNCLNNEHKDYKNSYLDFNFERSSCVNEAEFEKDREIRFTSRDVETFDYERQIDLDTSRGHKVG